MFDVLKTNDKFNPYMIVLPAIAALAVWQGGLIVGGFAKLVYESHQNKKTQK